MQTGKINSWEQLQAQISQILASMNEQPELALAAAVNPLFALEELGYEIEPAARPAIEDRLRFDHRVAVQRRQLRQKISELAGEEFDPDSAQALQRILYDKLKISNPESLYKQTSRTGGYEEIDLSPPRPHVRWLEPQDDPLDALRGKHPILEPLLEYRRLGTLAPQLAPRNIYEEVRSGKRALSVKHIKGRLKREQPVPVEPPVEPTSSTPPSPRSKTAPGERELDLNRAGVAELQSLPGVGEKLAQRIVDYRLAFGTFDSIESLKNVRGVGDDLLERVRPFIRVEGSEK
jgi:competence ComEA-like helix-hairpin-helix protein